MSACLSLRPALLVLLAAPLAAQIHPPPQPPALPAAGPAAGVAAHGALASTSHGDDVQANPVTIAAQNGASLAVHPNDPLNWVGVANDYSQGQPQTGWYTTLDGGATWTSGLFGVPPGFTFSGNPAVAIDTQGVVNVVCVMYDGPANENRVVSIRSDDGGLTWNAPVLLGEAPGYDKPQIEADLGDLSPTRDALLVAWNHLGSSFGVDDVVVATSFDQGLSWSAPQTINDASQVAIGPDVAWGPSGEAYVMWADRGAEDVMIDRSFDGGFTWAPDVKIADYASVPDTLPGNSFRVFDMFAIHADQTQGPFSGNVYVAWHTWALGTGENRSEIVASTSNDQGATWGTYNKVTTDGGNANDQLFPGVVVDRQGNVNVVYYDQRLDPDDKLTWTWISRSADGGQSWGDRQVSDVGWDDAQTEFPSFIGDYIDVDVDARGLVHPFWCDGRLGSQDLFTDSVNAQLFTNPDVVSAATGGQINFQIRIGPNHGNQGYILVLGGSGTSPESLVAGGITVPLVPDAWTKFSLLFAGSPFLPGSIGVLSAAGGALAKINTLGPLPPVLVGIELDASAIAFVDGIPTHATPPTHVRIGP